MAKYQVNQDGSTATDLETGKTVSLSTLKNYRVVSSKQEKSIGQKISSGIQAVFPGAQLGHALGTSYSGIKESLKQKSMAPIREAGAENRKNFGKIAGDVGQSLLFTGTGLQGLPALKGLSAGQKALSVGKAALREGVTGYGFDVTEKLIEGKKGKETLKPGIGTAVGAGVPVGLPVLGATKNAVGRGLSELSGAMTGQGYGGQKALLDAIQRGGNSAKIARSAMRGGISPEQIKQEADEALGSLFSNRTKSYQESLAKISGNKDNYDISPVIKELRTGLSDFKVGIKAGQLDFSQSPLRFNKKAQQDIQTIFDEMKSFGTRPGDRTPVGLDSLKRAFGDLYTESGEARKLVTKMSKSVRDVLKNVPGYDQMAEEYTNNTSLIKDIQKNLSMGDRASMDAAWKKFSSVLRNNDDAKSKLLQELDRASGGKLIPMVAGELSRPLLARGLTRPFAGLMAGGGAVTGATMSGVIKALILGGMSTSPRLAGEVVNILGLSRKYTKPIAKALSTLLLEYGDVGAVKEQSAHNQ